MLPAGFEGGCALSVLSQRICCFTKGFLQFSLGIHHFHMENVAGGIYSVYPELQKQLVIPTFFTFSNNPVIILFYLTRQKAVLPRVLIGFLIFCFLTHLLRKVLET